MVKVFQLACILCIVFVIIQQSLDWIKERKDIHKKSKETFAAKIIRWSENKNLAQLHPKEGSSVYKELLKIARESSIPWMTVERLNTTSILFGVIGIFIFIAYHVSNVVTALLNHDKLLLVAEEMQDESLAVVSYFSSNTVIMCLACFAIGYFAPWVYIKVIHFRTDNLTRQEAVMMKTYAIMMLKTNKNVKFVIEVMYKRAEMFKESLGRLWSRYSLDPITSLQEAMDETESEDFKKIINTLYKSVKFDRASAVEYLERDREMSQQLKKIRNKQRNQTKDSISTMLMMVPLLMAIVLVGYPLMLLAVKYIGTTPI